MKKGITPMSDLTLDLIRAANEIGGNTEFSRAGGGNASVKKDGVLYIKPSGVPLATLKAEDLVPLRIDVLLDARHSDEQVDGDPVRVAAERARVGEDDGRRPSVEILFHALIPEPLVLHLHPLTANALTCNEDGPALAAKILGDEAVWVDYIDPGVPLARGVEQARDAHAERTGKPAPGIVLLGNHGIIVSATATRRSPSGSVSSRMRSAPRSTPRRRALSPLTPRSRMRRGSSNPSARQSAPRPSPPRPPAWRTARRPPRPARCPAVR